MIDILHKHLNKYLINIIREYNEIDIDKLVSKIPTKNYCSRLKEKYTIEDLIMKSFHLGKMGFCVYNDGTHSDIIIYLDSKMNEKIEKELEKDKYYYSFLNDKRNLKYINLLSLNVFEFF